MEGLSEKRGSGAYDEDTQTEYSEQHDLPVRDMTLAYFGNVRDPDREESDVLPFRW